MVEGESTDPSAEFNGERCQELENKINLLINHQLENKRDYRYMGTKTEGGIEQQSFELFFPDTKTLEDDEIDQLRRFMYTEDFKSLIRGRTKDIRLTDITDNGVIITFYVQPGQAKTEKKDAGEAEK